MIGKPGKRQPAKHEVRRWQRPSAALLKYARQIIGVSRGVILDVPCGYGRNARLMSSLGCTVLCVDNDPEALAAIQDTSFSLWGAPQIEDQGCGPGLLIPLSLDLAHDPWPFAENSIGAILNIHFVKPTLLPYFSKSLIPGGYLLMETFSGRGGNYLQLPRPGELYSLLSSDFEFDTYEEKRVGPNREAVSVKLLARKTSVSCPV
jgi:SAM-dependent methyltransferase